MPIIKYKNNSENNRSKRNAKKQQKKNKQRQNGATGTEAIVKA